MESSLTVPYALKQNYELMEWKKNGRKIIGYFCSSFPKELIYASGALPVRILGSSKPIEQANDAFCRYACSLSRSAVDLALKNEFDILDGTVFSYTCDVMHYLAPRWSQLPTQQDKFWYYLTRPTNSNTLNASKFFKQELIQLKESIERYFSTSITEGALISSIEEYNRNRLLLQEIDQLKKQGIVNSVEAQKAYFMSMLSPPKRNNAFLESFIKKMKAGQKTKTNNHTRLFVSGPILPNTEFLELIEEEGGKVVDDDLCVGTRYFRSIIQDEQDPMLALAKYYIAEDEISRQCPSMLTEGRYEKRLEYIKSSIQEYDIKGVIFVIPYNCDKHYWDLVWFVRDLKAFGIPSLIIQQEGYMKAESIRNRVAAFMEMVG